MNRSHWLFCPGPVMVPDRVRQALFHPDMCHRVSGFEKIIQNVQKNLLKVFNANEEYTILLITGSGTAANETVISSYFGPQDNVLLVKNGEFGERLAEISKIHGVKTTIIPYDWGACVDISDVENALQKHPEITSVMMVFHETSTSVINPVSQVGQLARKYGKSFVVDGVSAVGGEDVNVARDHIDFCTTSSNKCLAGLPGIGIICAKRSELEKTMHNKTRVAYLNLYRLYKMSETRHQTPNTPSVTMFFALDAAVERLLEEGLENRINRYKRCARVIRRGVREMGLRLLVDDAIASNTVTSVFLPEKISMDEFIRVLENKGYTLYPGKGVLRGSNMFQIANMGEVDEKMCLELLQVIKESIDELRP